MTTTVKMSSEDLHNKFFDYVAELMVQLESDASNELYALVAKRLLQVLTVYIDSVSGDYNQDKLTRMFDFVAGKLSHAGQDTDPEGSTPEDYRDEIENYGRSERFDTNIPIHGEDDITFLLQTLIHTSALMSPKHEPAVALFGLLAFFAPEHLIEELETGDNKNVNFNSQRSVDNAMTSVVDGFLEVVTYDSDLSHFLSSMTEARNKLMAYSLSGDYSKAFIQKRLRILVLFKDSFVIRNFLHAVNVTCWFIEHSPHQIEDRNYASEIQPHGSATELFNGIPHFVTRLDDLAKALRDSCERGPFQAEHDAFVNSDEPDDDEEEEDEEEEDEEEEAEANS